MTAIEQLERDARAMFRLIGPRVSAAQDESATVKLCTRCTPEPKSWECFLCGLAFPDQWRYDMHIKINPETCQRYATKWAKKYAEMHT